MGDYVAGKGAGGTSRRWLVWGKAALYALGAVALVVAEVLCLLVRSGPTRSSGSSDGGDDGGGDS
jgi:hypothetical protein